MIEYLLLAVILATLFFSRPFRDWFSNIGLAEKLIGSTLVLIMLVFHFIDVSRTTFPFVRWAMYSEIFEPSEMEWGSVQARLQDGTLVPINTAQQFPSLSRNFAERFGHIVAAREDGTLTPLGEQAFQELLMAIGEKYNLRHPTNPVVQLSAMTKTISVQQGRANIRERWVASVKLQREWRDEP